MIFKEAKPPAPAPITQMVFGVVVRDFKELGWDSSRMISSSSWTAALEVVSYTSSGG